jgi:hypothetical protein
MAEVKIEVADDQLDRVLVAFADEFEWADDGTLDRPEFLKKIVAQWIKDITINNERKRALQAMQHDEIDIA